MVETITVAAPEPGVPKGDMLENRTFDELVPGDTASLSHTVMQRDIDLFAAATGDFNPAHVDPVYAATDMFHHVHHPRDVGAPG